MNWNSSETYKAEAITRQKQKQNILTRTWNSLFHRTPTVQQKYEIKFDITLNYIILTDMQLRI